MYFEAEASIDLDVDDIIDEMTDSDKKEMFEKLADEFNNNQIDLVEDIVGELKILSPFELKKVLCNALYVDNYYNDEGLRRELEKIITAR